MQVPRDGKFRLHDPTIARLQGLKDAFKRIFVSSKGRLTRGTPSREAEYHGTVP